MRNWKNSKDAAICEESNMRRRNATKVSGRNGAKRIRIAAKQNLLFPAPMLECFQVANDSVAGGVVIFVRLRKVLGIYSRLAKALKAEVVQNARQWRVTTVPTVRVK
jgi:hypothetical protein